MRINKTEEEIDDVLNRASEAEDEGVSKYPGMSYEQGIKAALEWALGLVSENPLD